MCRAAWPHVKQAGYGRIVNTTSGGMWGMPGLTLYGAAKFGNYGLTRGLALEGAAPRHQGQRDQSWWGHQLVSPLYEIHQPEALEEFIATSSPELVSPAMAYLAHESSELTGGLFDVTAGSVIARLFGTTAGYYNPELTIEDVRDNVDTILDASTFTIVTDPRDTTETENNQLEEVMEPKSYQPL